MRGVKSRGDGELVVELALALEGAGGVHELEGKELAGRKGGFVDGAETAMAKEGGGGEGGSRAAEKGIGEAALVVVGWSGTVEGKLAI